jgi:hypothetical protein
MPYHPPNSLCPNNTPLRAILPNSVLPISLYLPLGTWPSFSQPIFSLKIALYSAIAFIYFVPFTFLYLTMIHTELPFPFSTSLVYSSTLKMEEGCSSDTVVSIEQSTCHIFKVINMRISNFTQTQILLFIFHALYFSEKRSFKSVLNYKQI